MDHASDLAAAKEFLTKYIHKIALREWSYDVDLPDYFLKKLCQGEKIDLAVNLALLPQLYRRDAIISYGLLEAFLWSKRGKAILRAMGWLEGNLVLVDVKDKKVSSPHVESPAETVCFPVLWGYDPDVDDNAIVAKVHDRMSSDLLATRMKTIMDSGKYAFVNSADSMEDLLRFLREDNYEAQLRHLRPWKESVLGPALESVKKFANCLGIEPAQLNDESLTKQIVANFRDRLVHILLAEEISSYRAITRSQDYEDTTEFLAKFQKFGKRTNGGLDISPLERELEVLFVEDPQISLLLVEFCWSQLDYFDCAGIKYPNGLNDQDLHEKLGLVDSKQQITSRTKTVANWVKSIIDTPSGDKSRTLAQKRWRHTALGNDAKHESLKKCCETILAPQARGKALSEFLTCFFDSHPRAPRVLRDDFNLRPQIHLLLRHRETHSRNHIAFPITSYGPNNNLANQEIIGCFLGTISNSDSLDTEEQIGLLRSLVSPCVRDIINRRVVEKKQKAVTAHQETKDMQEAAFVFGHDLKNRLDEISSSKHIKFLKKIVKSSVDSDTVRVLRNAIASFQRTNDIYGISELFRQISKLNKGQLPISWARDQSQAENWVQHFEQNAQAYLEEAGETLRNWTRYVIGSYCEDAQDKNEVLELREIGENCQIKNLTHIQMNEELPIFKIPGLLWEEFPSAPCLAVLAGLSELIRNSARHMLHPSNRGPIKRNYDKLHVDFRIDQNPERGSVSISLWNPYQGLLIPSQTMEKLKAMYSRGDFVSIEDVKEAQHPCLPGKDYARSSVSFFFKNISFSS